MILWFDPWGGTRALWVIGLAREALELDLVLLGAAHSGEAHPCVRSLEKGRLGGSLG